VHLYDGINLAALAMLAAHSTSSSAYMPWILKIGDGTPGATVVNSFAQAPPHSRQASRSATRARVARQLRRLHDSAGCSKLTPTPRTGREGRRQPVNHELRSLGSESAEAR